jgi:hypothetical protein
MCARSSTASPAPARPGEQCRAVRRLRLTAAVLLFTGALCVFVQLQLHARASGSQMLKEQEAITRLFIAEETTQLGQPTAADCGTVLQVPKVALLFLTVGPLPHHQTWEQWLKAARGWLPTDAVRAACDGPAALSPCRGTGRDTKHAAIRSDPLDGQFLFSLYIHTPPNNASELNNPFLSIFLCLSWPLFFCSPSD